MVKHLPRPHIGSDGYPATRRHGRPGHEAHLYDWWELTDAWATEHPPMGAAVPEAAPRAEDDTAEPVPIICALPTDRANPHLGSSDRRVDYGWMGEVKVDAVEDAGRRSGTLRRDYGAAWGLHLQDPAVDVDHEEMLPFARCRR